LLLVACKKAEESKEVPKDEDFRPAGDIADLVYNPVRSDGTIDSSYLPILKWDENIFDFGTIFEGDVVEKKFTFSNVGTAPLIIITATSTCGCTVPEWPKTRILPDSSGTVLVKFNSRNKIGAQNKEVTIFANTLPNQSKLTIKGTVKKPN
jgi:hypothetical protein